VLSGRVAIVTGAGRGIGRAHALRLAAYGARVVVNDADVGTDGAPTDEAPADEVVATIRAAGGDAVSHRGSVTETATGDELVTLAVDTWGRVDIVVNNAGIGRPRMVFNLGDDEWDDVLAVHLRGTFALSRAACRWWRDDAKRSPSGTTYGRLVNTSTGLLLVGGAGQSNYVAAKAAVAAFTDAVAQEMARYGVTANTLMPGAMTRLAAIGWRTAEARDAAAAAGVPFDATDPVHVAEFVSYLASPAAAWISGQTFQVAGSRVQHVRAWDVATQFDRPDAGWTAAELVAEVPRMFGAGPRRADPPPKQWSDHYHAKDGA
jgi:NAD(P)-dependent dehydrogenase (short-subunit alcohol dehydrogenase family)